MMSSFLGALSSRSMGKPLNSERAEPSPLVGSKTLSSWTSPYGNDNTSVVRVTTKCGLTLEADAVIVTLPLAILSIPPGDNGHISFKPPLPTAKLNALNRLGVGSYNKCEFS